ncbi:hypothetical protein TAMA11512_15380 [Selenomonas sp. TAMA-11512]|uniref:DUF4391 domain-containing protein n=1 Tax=Selenomonas sp. TAMA-11512 TaxID=3095337 RepID=UPI0030866AF2|nr:hypothetical protein TAMA11512_15380 [Selenomonas sp. TAMA-11512]
MCFLVQKAITLRLEGLSMDVVYENLVRRIAGAALGADTAVTLKQRVAEQVHRERLAKQIAALEGKIAREKQPKKKVALVQQLCVLQGEMDEGLYE